MAAGSLQVLPEGWGSALAIVAHPDDLEYGAASAIAKWTSSGKAVTYVLATRGEAGLAIAPALAGPLREAEERASAALVGVSTVEFLDHRDGVVENSLALRRDLSRVIRRYRPDVVIGTNFRDTWGGPSFNMADHRHVGLATLDAIRDAANPWIFPELVDEGHSPWAGVTMACFGGSPQATHFVDVTGWLDRGIESLEAHRAYLEHVNTNARTMLTEFAESAGFSAGVEHAALFEVIQP